MSFEVVTTSMKENQKHSIVNLGKAIYPLRIFGFLMLAISIFLSYSKLDMELDFLALFGIGICLIYPHVAYLRFIKNEERTTELSNMLIDMALQGMLFTLVHFSPSVVLPFIIANSAANYSLRGIKQAIKGIVLAILAAIAVLNVRVEAISWHVEPIELITPFLYLTLVTHYMGYTAYVRGTALIRRRKKAEELAHQDFLTGLHNRRSMFEQVQLNDNRRITNSDESTLIMIDLDHFKQVNDKYGHDHGDAILIWVSEILQNTIRETDIAARWGGEEFLVLLPQANKSDGLKIAESIKQAIANGALSYEGVNHKVTATMGVASYDVKTSFEKTLKFADEALYQGKQQGRNRIVLVQ